MVEYQLPKLGVAGSSPVARFFKNVIKEPTEHTERHGKNTHFLLCILCVPWAL